MKEMINENWSCRIINVIIMIKKHIINIKHLRNYRIDQKISQQKKNIYKKSKQITSFFITP